MAEYDDITKMHPADIEAALKKRGRTYADVGRSLNLPRQVVSAVINHQAAVNNEITKFLIELPEVSRST